MSKIAIKIIPNAPFHTYIAPLRKYTSLAIIEIKNKIANRDFIAETYANDLDNMEKLKELIDNLLDLGAEIKIFESDEYGKAGDYQKISHQEFMNSIEQLKEIMEELQDYDDALADEV
ncbi:hypothetical protein [Bacillus pseudomycoides]|uniref:hypothetical protein n=1 Tax=Bacillus pseudomycoides TaxID=64104 RepID=UPI0001A15447|nr:hypothetical protein [Bacillus pseudomycoides]EEM02878.1 hypothetical protein bmyco0002_46840 [Bacillus pseudomycoides]KFN13437.1 hypothetical protein DJ94_4633 [Bacillus pseudomycoides]MDR4189813.1 hypothetical protein [Bacillus pseudomycoides]MED0854246.1 hypothetical protein [Bacillus pseudomycoides]PDZ73743.1 hypothetical protein CON58_10830 [Bacillus pseudomycoides]